MPLPSSGAFKDPSASAGFGDSSYTDTSAMADQIIMHQAGGLSFIHTRSSCTRQVPPSPTPVFTLPPHPVIMHQAGGLPLPSFTLIRLLRMTSAE